MATCAIRRQLNFNWDLGIRISDIYTRVWGCDSCEFERGAKT